jgi:membrane-associated protein
VVWTDGLFLMGHFLGNSVPHIDRYIIPGVIVVLIISVIPIILEMRRGRRATGDSGNGPNKKTSEESRPSLSGDSSR